MTFLAVVFGLVSLYLVFMLFYCIWQIENERNAYLFRYEKSLDISLSPRYIDFQIKGVF
jgi:hypothetical protein